jgi:hypothetical protein
MRQALLKLTLSMGYRRIARVPHLAGLLPFSNGAVMRKALAIGLEAFEPANLLWGLLAGELALTLVLAASDRLPSVLIRSLQLFLRF